MACSLLFSCGMGALVGNIHPIECRIVLCYPKHFMTRCRSRSSFPSTFSFHNSFHLIIRRLMLFVIDHHLISNGNKWTNNSHVLKQQELQSSEQAGQSHNVVQPYANDGCFEEDAKKSAFPIFHEASDAWNVSKVCTGTDEQ